MDERQPAAGEPRAETAAPAGAVAEPGRAMQRFADWAPAAPDAVPIFPRGTALFEGIPAPAIVIEALAPVIGDGALVSRRSGSVGVILIKEAGLFEVYAYEGGKRFEGQKALQLISGWNDATVSAYQLDRNVVAAAPSLCRGSPCHADLRLEWTDWKGLLADLCDRGGLFVVEFDTPVGRGVTMILGGRQVATYTESHPELGPEGLLDPLAATRRGTIRVRRELATPAPVVKPIPVSSPGAAPTAPEPARAALVAAKPVAAPGNAAPLSVGIGWSTAPLGSAATGGVRPPGPAVAPAPPAAPQAAVLQAEPFDPFALLEHADDHVHPTPSVATPSVAEVAVALKQLARAHLLRQSPRVEAMVDDAVAQRVSLGILVDEVRGLVIRGVTSVTLAHLADEMDAVVPALPH
ncbi:MAG TPA: hypothetical protein DEG26_08970 [Chloroflexi bacterium]|jgi:hypothetical protein|nr:hypothetical protein [Chloroflexota bacterium]